MKTVEGEQHDHPHHRGLNFGHESIAGYDTWAERATFGEGKKTNERIEHLGAIKLREITKMEGGEKAIIRTVSDHADAAGKRPPKKCASRAALAAQGANRLIDLDIVLIASEGDIVVDDKGRRLSIRVPTEMAVEKAKKAAKALAKSSIAKS